MYLLDVHTETYIMQFHFLYFMFCLTSHILHYLPLFQFGLITGHHFLPSANCSDPTVPTDGRIDPYHSTTEGAEIFFRCNPGFVPAGRMTAVCMSDGRWNPDPAGHGCTCKISSYVLCQS